MLAPWKKSYDKLKQCVKKQRHYSSDKHMYSWSYGFSRSNVWMWESESEVTQLCPTLSDPMDCSLPGSSAHGIFQARVLVWVAIAMWALDHKEDWVPKNWCFWTVELDKTLVHPLDSKKIKLVNPKGNQSWIFIGRTDAEAEAPILWPPNAKSRFIRKDPDAGKDWSQEE